MVHFVSSSHLDAYQKRLELAAEDVKINKSSVRKASKAFDVSRCALNHLLKFDTGNIPKVGRQPALKKEEDQMIAAAVVQFGRNVSEEHRSGFRPALLGAKTKEHTTRIAATSRQVPQKLPSPPSGAFPKATGMLGE